MARFFLCGLGLLAVPVSAFAQETPSYARHVRPFLARYCSECHNPRSHKAGLDLDSFKALMEGSDNGPVVVAGKASESRLVTLVNGKEKPVMPPPKSRSRPTKAEIARLEAWVNAGAKDDSAFVKVELP